jgi:hypothetical protein
MESKAAEERVQSNVEAPTIAALMEGKEEAARIIRCDDVRPARLYWANVKSKARSFGEYAILRTRQGISMFGEPKLESLIKGADESR